MTARLFVRMLDQHTTDAPSELLVSSAEVELVGAHDRVRIWNRGGLAGELVVQAGDGERIAARLGLEPVSVPSKEWLREAALYQRNLDDGRDITVYHHNWSQYAVCVSKQGSGDIDESFYYRTRDIAIAAAEHWDGNGDAPIGWFRHPNSGRRREDGDPSTEYVQR